MCDIVRTLQQPIAPGSNDAESKTEPLRANIGHSHKHFRDLTYCTSYCMSEGTVMDFRRA